MKKFSNFYQEMKCKWGVSGMLDAGINAKPFKLFEERMGRQLFEDAQKDSINKAATEHQMTSASEPNNHAAHYQAALKEMWEALDDNERQEYEKVAQDHSDDVFQFFFFFLPICSMWLIQIIIRNQEKFMPAMWKQLTHLCQNGKVGDAEMMLLFAFRDKEGDVYSGV
jgi:hypothetical protein